MVGNYFEEIPDSWDTLSEADQLAFVEEHACETFQHHAGLDLWEEIESSAMALARFMEEAGA